MSWGWRENLQSSYIFQGADHGTLKMSLAPTPWYPWSARASSATGLNIAVSCIAIRHRCGGGHHYIVPNPNRWKKNEKDFQGAPSITGSLKPAEYNHEAWKKRVDHRKSGNVVPLESCWIWLERRNSSKNHWMLHTAQGKMPDALASCLKLGTCQQPWKECFFRMKIPVRAEWRAKKGSLCLFITNLSEVGDLVGMIKMGIMIFSESVKLTSRQSNVRRCHQVRPQIPKADPQQVDDPRLGVSWTMDPG